MPRLSETSRRMGGPDEQVRATCSDRPDGQVPVLRLAEVRGAAAQPRAHVERSGRQHVQVRVASCRRRDARW
eukprot:15475086-Alexandrium_andersonii.AAC.1